MGRAKKTLPLLLLSLGTLADCTYDRPTEQQQAGLLIRRFRPYLLPVPCRPVCQGQNSVSQRMKKFQRRAEPTSPVLRKTIFEEEGQKNSAALRRQGQDSSLFRRNCCKYRMPPAGQEDKNVWECAVGRPVGLAFD